MLCPSWTRRLCSVRLSIHDYCSKYSRVIVNEEKKTAISNVRQCHSENKRWNVLFFGTDHFSLPHLEMMERTRRSGSLVNRLEVVVPESKFIKRRGKTRKTSPVWDFCQEEKLPRQQWPLSDNISGFDVGVIVSFGYLLPEWLIQSFPLGILNVHPSLLPRWRGGAPIQHTILSGDPVTGVSIMRILPDRFDIGPILLQRECSVPCDSTTESLSDLLAKMGSDMLLEVFSDLTYHIKNETPQKEGGVTLGLKIPPTRAWIDWGASTLDINRLFRAIGGQMSLKTLYGDEELRLEQMLPLAECLDLALDETDEPGIITFNKHKNAICVRCKDGWVGFRTVSPVGRKRMTAKEFNNGYLSASRGDTNTRPRRFSNRDTTHR